MPKSVIESLDRGSICEGSPPKRVVSCYNVLQVGGSSLGAPHRGMNSVLIQSCIPIVASKIHFNKPRILRRAVPAWMHSFEIELEEDGENR